MIYQYFFNLHDCTFKAENMFFSAIYLRASLREKCLNTEFLLVRIFSHSDWLRRDTKYLSVFSPNAGKHGPEKTPYLDTFHAENNLWMLFEFDKNQKHENDVNLFGLFSACFFFTLLCNVKSSRSQMFFKTDVLKNFAIFTEKHLCWSLFLIKLQALRGNFLNSFL